MIYQWLVIFSNISGITFVKVPKIIEWKESNFLKAVFLVKLFCMSLFFFALWLSTNFEKYVFDFDVIDGYSGFSIEILEISFKCYHIGGLVLLTSQYRCRKQVRKFLASFEGYELKESSKVQFKKRIVCMIIVKLIFLVVNGVLLYWIILRRDDLFHIVSFYIIMQTHFTYYGLVMLFLYVQSFIVVALKEVKENINYLWRRAGHVKSVLNQEKIEILLEVFIHTFGYQLTLITTINLLLLVTLVSCRLLVYNFCEINFFNSRLLTLSNLYDHHLKTLRHLQIF